MDLPSCQNLDLTPSWRTAAHIYIEVLRNPDASAGAVKTAKEELLRCASALDRLIAKQKEK